MTTENTVMKAWCSAREQRDLSDDFIFHSDRGVQYASNKMTNLFSLNRKVKQSMSRKGNCWDNAVAESFLRPLNMNGSIDLSFILILSYTDLYTIILPGITTKDYILV